MYKTRPLQVPSLWYFREELTRNNLHSYLGQDFSKRESHSFSIRIA